MARNGKDIPRDERRQKREKERPDIRLRQDIGGEARLHPDARKSIWGIVFIGLAIVFALAGIGRAGPVGIWTYGILHALLGVGYFIFPLTLLFAGLMFFASNRERFLVVTLIGALLLILSVLGLIDIFSPSAGGWLGKIFGALQIPFGKIAAGVMNIALLAISAVMVANAPIRLSWERRKERQSAEAALMVSDGMGTEGAKEKPAAAPETKVDEEITVAEQKEAPVARAFAPKPKKSSEGYHYNFPPLTLLQSSIERPTTGDLRANANIIKRTLESFGIPVEMGEINIGPKVTRYTLKPAEGVKLSRIIALNQDLSLALAAHPIRIEAPIPGKSLVGIEVPNKAAAIVRLGSLIAYPEFRESGP